MSLLRAWRRVTLGLFGIAGLLAAVGCIAFVSMPGRTFVGPPPEASESALEQRLRAHVVALAGEIGERNAAHPEALERAALYVEQQLRASGYQVRQQVVEVDGEAFRNLEAELPGTAKHDEILVVGAHYDSVRGSPGADDNASGVAVLLELAARQRATRLARTLRFVAFVHEEPPYFQTERMGSRVYAAELARRGEKVHGMLSLETLGYFTTAPGSQRYPPLIGWLYPDRGDFIGFVGNTGSRALVRSAIAAFRETAKLPSEGIAAPDSVPGIGWSDHWSFWQHDYAALMVTDTAPFRFPEYHRERDLPELLDYAAMREIALGLETVIGRLAEE
jgi:Zn-dependent M28 family amino/carboxypeptidase